VKKIKIRDIRSEGIGTLALEKEYGDEGSLVEILNWGGEERDRARKS